MAGLKQGNVTWLPGRISEGMVAEAVPDVAQRAVSSCAETIESLSPSVAYCPVVILKPSDCTDYT